MHLYPVYFLTEYIFLICHAFRKIHTRKNPVNFHRLLHARRYSFEYVSEFGNLICHQKSEVAAFHLSFFHFRQISEDRNPALPLNNRPQVVKKSCATLIQNEPSYVILRPEIHKPADLGSQRGALPARLYDQNDRCAEQLCDVIGAGLSRTADTVIEAHRALDDCQGLFCFANTRRAIRLLHSRLLISSFYTESEIIEAS